MIVAMLKCIGLVLTIAVTSGLHFTQHSRIHSVRNRIDFDHGLHAALGQDVTAGSTNEMNHEKKSVQRKKKSRIDDYLIEVGIAKDRAHANALVMMGAIYYETGEAVKSASQLVDTNKLRKLKSRSKKEKRFVSRAGQKLYGAIEEYDSVAKAISGAVCVDIGASTGGFTDCLLQHGAEKVYAVDVGQSLLDWKIRSDSRVVVVEKCNARYLNSTLIPRDERFDMVVCDVSFISLKKVLPPSLALCKDGAHLCCLIKPQFECAKEDIGTGGIVRDTEVRERCVDDVLSWFAQSYPQWSIRGTSRSCITGTDGNVEYILVAQLTNKQDSEVDSMMVSDVISES